MEPIRIAKLGAGKRATYLYHRIIQEMDEVEIVAAWSRSKDSARQLGEKLGVPWFTDGRVGIFHWTNVGYDSGLRWWRSSRFYAERGMGITHGTYNEPVTELTSIGPDSHGPRPVVIQRELERCDGGALKCIRALTGEPSSGPGIRVTVAETLRV